MDAICVYFIDHKGDLVLETGFDPSLDPEAEAKAQAQVDYNNRVFENQSRIIREPKFW
jgi:hypothetical protein